MSRFLRARSPQGRESSCGAKPATPGTCAAFSVGNELVCVTCADRYVFDANFDVVARRSHEAPDNFDIYERQVLAGANGLVFSLREDNSNRDAEITTDFLVAYADGEQVWRVDLGQRSFRDGAVAKLAAGPDGPYVVGLEGSGFGVTAFANDGSMRWHVARDGALVAADGAGGTFVLTQSQVLDVSATAMLDHLDATGASTWSRTVTSKYIQSYAGRLVETMKAVGTSVVLAGRFNATLDLGDRMLTSSSPKAMYVAELDAGVTRQALTFELESSSRIDALAKIGDDYLVGGQYAGANSLGLPSSQARDGFVARLTPAGTATSVYPFGGAENQDVTNIVVGDEVLFVEVVVLPDDIDAKLELVVKGRQITRDRTHHVLEVGL